jgi:2-methylcitrate dehydratase PrpD
VIGTSQRASIRDAALANGIAAHALEIDDVALWMPGHVGACVCPAALALAEVGGRSGDDLLAAIVAGYDVACRVGSALGSDHGRAGWHVTGTAGTFAAAAAASRALQASQEQTRNALGLAATEAAGLIASFGTFGKSLHTGKAAADGVLAALLAERGGTGAPNGLEAFGTASSSTFDPERPERELGDNEGIRSTIFKRYGCSGYVHIVSDAVLWLRRKRHLSAGDVASIEIATSADAISACTYDEPATGIQAKFSFPHAAAAAFVCDVESGPRFDDDEAWDERVRDLARRVSVTGIERAGAGVTVECVDGRRLERWELMDTPVEDHELPAQWDRLVQKFERVVVQIAGADRAAALISQVTAIEHTRDVRTLTELLGEPA